MLLNIAFLILSGLLVISIVETDAVVELIKRADLWLFSTSVLLLMMQSLIVGLRSGIIMHIVVPTMKLRAILGLNFTSAFLGQFLPSGLGADIVKIIMLQKHDFSITNALQAIANDRLLTLLFQISLCWCFFPFLAVNMGNVFNSSVVFFLLSLSFAVGFILIKLQSQIIAFIGRISAFSSITKTAIFFLPHYTKKKLGVYFLLNLVSFFFIAASLIASSNAIGIGISSLALVIFLPFCILLSILPISIGGWGIRELLFILYFSSIQLTSEEAVALSVFWGVSGAFSYIATFGLYRLATHFSRQIHDF